jgi:uncharacterized protein YgbK (DUF1537 family)
MSRMKRDEVLKGIPLENIDSYRINKIRDAVIKDRKRIVVLDDDPTGTQTVNNVEVLTVWDVDVLQEAFLDEITFFILTNTRGMSDSEARILLDEIMDNIMTAAELTDKDFVVIARGDSTLRGHYPMETQVIKEKIEKRMLSEIHGEIIIPYFKEGHRFTYNDIHYIEEDGCWTPVGKSEFAKDLVFGYQNSDLKEWIEEKTNRNFLAENVVSISLEDIRVRGADAIAEKLLNVVNFGKVIVNAVEDSDLEIFTLGLLKAEEKGKKFIFRTAASFVRIRCGIERRPLLTREEIIKVGQGRGGLIVVGSHVNKSTRQLKNALELNDVASCEIDVEKLLSSEFSRKEEIEKVASIANQFINLGQSIILYTSRKLNKSDNQLGRSNMDISQIISNAIVEVVRGIKTEPSYLIAKGGITSSDICTKGLEVRTTKVIGQIREGIPVWQINNRLSYVIFPGNVGTENDLKDIIEQLN